VLDSLAKSPDDRPQVAALGRQLATAVGLGLPPGLMPDYVSTLRMGAVSGL
jgi:hypothetical protein